MNRRLASNKNKELIVARVEVDPKREKYDYGNFGWFTDPEGNRVELWQP